MARQRFPFDVPACPACGEPAGVLASFKARADRYDCPRCNAALKIPKPRQFVLFLILYLSFVKIGEDVPGIRGILIVACLTVIVGSFEYLTARLVPSSRRRKQDPR